MNLNTKMTAQELEQMIAQMERIFTVVRILDKDLLHKMDGTGNSDPRTANAIRSGKKERIVRIVRHSARLR